MNLGAGCDNYGKLPTGCYKTALFVSTTAGEILKKSWNGLKFVITLHCQSEQTTPVRTDSTKKQKRIKINKYKQLKKVKL
jgi:hypothetical protein